MPEKNLLTCQMANQPAFILAKVKVSQFVLMIWVNIKCFMYQFEKNLKLKTLEMRNQKKSRS